MEKSDTSYYNSSVSLDCSNVQNTNICHNTSPLHVTLCGVVITAMLVDPCISFSENDLFAHNAIVQSYDSGDTNSCTNNFILSSPSSEVQETWLFFESENQKNPYAAQEYRAGGILSMLNREVPISFLLFSLLSTLFLCLTIYLLWAGFTTGAFVFNPIYLLEFAIGFLGLLVTSLVAIFEWRRKRGWKERGVQ